MTTLADVRAHLAATLAGDSDLLVHDTVPESVGGTCAVIQPAEDWVAPSDTFNTDEYDLTYEVWLLVEHRSNAQAAADLDDLLGKTLGRLLASDWAVDQINRPGPAHTADWLAHGQRLTVSITRTLTFT